MSQERDRTLIGPCKCRGVVSNGKGPVVSSRRVALRRSLVLLTFALFVVTFSAVAPIAARAATVYVSRGGSDTVGLGTVGSPFETVAKGVAEAQSGDTVDVGPGDFFCEATLTRGISLQGAGSSLTTLTAHGNVDPYNPVITVPAGEPGGRISGPVAWLRAV